MVERPKILIVEDEPAQREILLYHLKKAGFAALWADNGEEGLLLAQENLPDVLILDWMLPKLSGLEICPPVTRASRYKTHSNYFVIGAV